MKILTLDEYSFCGTILTWILWQ